MEDNELKLAESVLDAGHPPLRFPSRLEKEYIRYHAENRLIISPLLLFSGLAVFILFVILDFLVFPFSSAVLAWIIRGVTSVIVISVIFLYRFVLKRHMGHVIIAGSMIFVNAAVVCIDVLGVNSAGYVLAPGSLFVIIGVCTLIRFPFWVSLRVIGIMVLTQMAGLIFFTGLGVIDLLYNLFFFGFIIIMLLFLNYSVDMDSRKIFLLNIFRKKYEKSGLKNDDRENYARTLYEYMCEEKPFLDPELRIDDVAAALQVKRHYLSQIISEKYGMNFYSYINGFRVEEAKKLMSRSDEDINLLGIAFETGFNSKSTFNRTFKSLTGMTPSEFRKISR
ncbi:MAG: hypothetical protein CVV44_07300 [Spirochaetae bacterium HGW-Spirochaetae-1]|jgi:AraC-like DNA-binding protein|nr:MAG: hypothetical protein CVV44_07300 [Spirochaetae bacterium HGW-Spirochaetae-1]